MTEPGALEPGTWLAERYQVRTLLGQGGMGSVYRAHDRVLQREVAVKVCLAPATGRHADLEARLAREARALAQVRHPNIVQIYDCGTHVSTAFVVMELLEGEDLASQLRRGPAALPLATAVQLAVQLADALHAAHSAGIVHRDIKPSNLFLARYGARYVLKVLDFGLAKITLEGLSITDVNQMLGTLTYMSPEQVHNSKEVTDATDVYALGAILFELLTGSPPFTGATGVELSYHVLYDPPPRLDSRLPGAPAWLCDLVARCLAKDRTARPKASEVHAILQQHVPDLRESVVLLRPPLVVRSAEETLDLAPRVALPGTSTVAGRPAGVRPERAPPPEPQRGGGDRSHE